MSVRHIRKCDVTPDNFKRWLKQEERYKRYREKPEVKQKAAEAQNKRRKEFPERSREINRKSERKRKILGYGLTLENYNLMLLSQNNTCAICQEENFDKRDWHIDHCHELNIVRGLLCHKCNILLGMARDNLSILENAKNYLRRFNEQNSSDLAR